MSHRSRALVLWTVASTLLAVVPAAAFSPTLLVLGRSGKPAAADLESEKAGASSLPVQTLVANSRTLRVTDEAQLFTDWDTVPPVTAVGRAIAAVPGGFVLRKPGIYQIAIEGSLLYRADDATVDPQSAVLFGMVVGNEQTVFCATAPRLAASLLGPQALTQCGARTNVDVRGQGQVSLGQQPVVFPRNTLVELVLAPNEASAGADTLAEIFVVITKLGD